jgi:hypothetical protein
MIDAVRNPCRIKPSKLGREPLFATLLVYAFPRRRRRSIARCELICAAVAVDRLPASRKLRSNRDTQPTSGH